MTNAVDIVQLCAELGTRRRGRAAVVLTHNYDASEDNGVQLDSQSQWVSKLQQATGAHHINLHDYLMSSPEHATELGQFMPGYLFQYLKQYAVGETVILTGLEVVKATWAGQPDAVEQFCSQLENWNGGPPVLFVLQHDPQIAQRPFRRHPQYRFVIDQKETYKL